MLVLNMTMNKGKEEGCTFTADICFGSLCMLTTDFYSILPQTSISSNSDKRQTGPYILIRAQSSQALHEDDRIIVPFSENPSPL